MRKLPIVAAATLISLALGIGVALAMASAKPITTNAQVDPAATGKHKHHRHKRGHRHHTAKGKHKRTHKRHAPAAGPTPAPVLRVSGTKLKWNRINHIRRYVLATIRHPATTRNTTYRVVKGTSFRPKITAGHTLKYSVRADVRLAEWSKEVSVTGRKRKRPAPSGAAAPIGPVVTNPPATTPTTTPVAPSPVASQKLVVAVNDTTGWYDDPIFAKAGINADPAGYQRRFRDRSAEDRAHRRHASVAGLHRRLGWQPHWADPRPVRCRCRGNRPEC